jgi:DNA-binding PadR family transcriptional regulator
MVETKQLPPQLGRVILGLLLSGPLSGYELRKMFAATPLGHFSDSPGSIYPALRRLERQSLVRGHVEQAGSLRPRRVFTITAAGREMLRSWLEPPVTVEDVMHRSDDLVLRFSFMPGVLGKAKTIRFLEQWEVAVGQHVDSLEQYLTGATTTLSLAGRLAMESGIEGYRGNLRWTRHAAEALRQSGARGVRAVRKEK